MFSIFSKVYGYTVEGLISSIVPGILVLVKLPTANCEGIPS